MATLPVRDLLDTLDGCLHGGGVLRQHAQADGRPVLPDQVTDTLAWHDVNRMGEGAIESGDGDPDRGLADLECAVGILPEEAGILEDTAAAIQDQALS
jgi:hypothetical protein